MDLDHGLAQHIVIDSGGDHAGTILAAARASLGHYVYGVGGIGGKDRYQTWLQGSFTKVVRRERLDRWRRTLDFCSPDAYDVSVPGGRAFALSPMALGDVPRVVHRAQVAGTDLTRTLRPHFGAPDITIFVLRTLTTGKAAAQAAHALWMWALAQDTLPDLDAVSIHIREAGAARMSAHAARSGAFEVHDAGRTEVEPNTMTAVLVTQ